MVAGTTGLDGKSFDVIVVGGGANGASSTQHLAAAGYSVLLVEQSDFGSGTTSRSSRQLHCGLSYLAPGYDSFWRFLMKPRQWIPGLQMARRAMHCREHLVRTMPERLRRIPFIYPYYDDSRYARWQVETGFRVLERFATKNAPLSYRRKPAETAARDFPIIRELRDQDKLGSVGIFDEYQYEWAERICVDTILDSKRLGAEVRNYTSVVALESEADKSWRVTLQDWNGERATVHGAFLVNAAGPWIDKVNRLTAPQVGSKLVGIKGVNVLVRLPEIYRGVGLETLSRKNQAFYMMPWGDDHFFGPTETIYSGDPAEVVPTEDEIESILAEVRYVFPALGLTRGDVRYAWAGVRPRTKTANPDGLRAVALHELKRDGMGDGVAITGGPIMVHRKVGADIARRVSRSLRPTKAPSAPDYGAKLFPHDASSPPAIPGHPNVTIADLQHAAGREDVVHLTDLLFRRVSLGWTVMPSSHDARIVAGHVADILGWSDERINVEVADYARMARDLFKSAHAD